ncbi:hypothetical protein Suden_1663 [Sulfurimonas denitrificans DSM 1251]|uniref:OmpA-like domain-containing protein n=1 Tax=Sulfurimonas denitrificans (strain ATCC 33889 / DSM 1251) TaxID=326298 RepID=Q30PZ1_SULDN|nr:hypothetical protein [Sulfurimonas denitrificans]ABB44940.1 hypothetical protein Suden_1663 [Sulfurimonas denitrificans DSM 1251]MDD3442658.1 hypothetical protein [Sulfurimonas denitrificans]
MRYLLIIITLISSLYAKEAPFSIIIDEPFNNALLDITEDFDRSMSAVGFIKSYKNGLKESDGIYTNAFDYLASLSNSNGSLIHLVKVGSNADIELRKSIKLSQFAEALGVVKTHDNGYIVAGNTINGSLVIVGLDVNANMIFHKIFGTPNQDKMSKIHLLRDGGVLIIGSSTTSRTDTGNLFQGGLGLNDIYLAKFSMRGEMLWSKKYGSADDENGVDAAEAEDGSIIILGQKNIGREKIPTILRVTQHGEKIWLYDIKGEKNTTAHKILKLRDNTFALSLSQLNDMNKEQIRLLKVDLQQNILLDKTINTNYTSILKDIKEFSDGKIVGVGVVEDQYNSDGLAMLLDSNFKMLAQEHYGSDSRDAFYALKILHNSQIGAVGIHTDKDSQESNMWIVKLNSNLKMAQIFKNGASKANTNTLYAQLLELFRDEIATKKLIIKEDLSIELIDSALYFNVGEFVLTSNQKLFLEKFSLKLLPFLKKNKELFKTLEVSGHTSSEWGMSDFSIGYINNTELSMKRSFSTISYIFNIQNQETKIFLSELLKGSGFSFSKRVIVENREDKERSRRVSFRIIL